VPNTFKRVRNIVPGRNSAEIEEVQQETLIKGVLNCVHFIWLLRAAEAEKKETFKIENKIKGTVKPDWNRLDLYLRSSKI
jgi:hypothetical protein